jgi:RND family efflux transporter MFP subunit
MKRLLPLFCAALLLAGCGNEAVKRDATQTASPVAVTAAAVSEQPWPSVYEATGTVRARTSTVIAARMMAYVRDVKVQEGDHVREGQPLISLDSRDLDIGLSHASAALDEIHTSIPEADSAVAAAQASLDLAETTFKRMQDLFAKHSISNQEFDEANAKLKSAQAQLAMARARRAQLDAQALRAQQDVKASAVSRTYAEIAAPFAGVVTAKSVEPGAMTTPGAPLLTIEREDSYRLEAGVEESKLGSIKVGQTVSVTLDSSAQPVMSRVAEITPVVDAASRSYTVKIDLPSRPGIRSGMFGRASFALGSRNVRSIPAAAARENGQLQSVFVIENGIARGRLITLGEKSGGSIEVLSGLSPGEKVVAPIPAGLTDGAPVEVRP